MIDTLILSGGGPSGIAYIGIFKSLFDNNIIDSQLTNIKEIITTSVGIIFSILLMTKRNFQMIENLMMGCDINTILNLDDIDINAKTLEERYKKQFSAMESIISSFKNTGEFLTNLMDATNNKD